MESTLAIKIASRLEIASARDTTALDINIVDRDVVTASRSAKNVVVAGLRRSRTGDVLNRNVLNDNAIRRVASGASVEVVLLDIDTVYGRILDTNVLEQDVGDKPGCVRVGLDTRTVLCVENHRVGKGDVSHVVVYNC
jgi:hypothetical protein